MSVSCVFVTFVVFTDCELHEAGFHKPSTMDVDKYGLTRGACFEAHLLDMIVVAGLLWISSCVLCAAGFFRALFLNLHLSFERTWPAASMRPPCLIYLSTSTNCESCTTPISTNPTSMGADEYMLKGRASS